MVVITLKLKIFFSVTRMVYNLKKNACRKGAFSKNTGLDCKVHHHRKERNPKDFVNFKKTVNKFIHAWSLQRN